MAATRDRFRSRVGRGGGRAELAQLTAVVTVWHEGAGRRATSRATRRTRRRTSRGRGARYNLRIQRTPTEYAGRYANGVCRGHSHLALLPFCRENRTGEDDDDDNDGTETADAHREREGDEKHHATRKRPQVVEIARGGIAGWALALSSLPFCRLWIRRVSNHPKYQNGLKMRRGRKALLLILIWQTIYNSSICERD